jgi:acyl-CoA synthetase (AMP-forming)/AMP-acid ligase II
LLDEQAQERPDQVALVFPEGSPSSRTWAEMRFGELRARTDALVRGLRDHAGLKPGDRVMMLVPPGFEFFEISFALWKLGCVPVLIDPGMGLDGFLSCVTQIQPRVLVGIPKAMLLSLVKRKAFASVEQRVTVGSWTFPWGGVTVDDCRMDGEPLASHPVDADTEAAILFTSGSTGPAKGVRYTHGMFRTQAQWIQRIYGIKPGQVDVPCFLPFAMFSCVMGLTVVLPDMDFAKPATAEPARLVEAIRAYEAQQLVGSPAVMKRLAPWAKENGGLESLERVLTFGAPIPRTLHAAFKHVLAEGVEIHTPYGATEALPIASIASAEILDDAGERTAMGEGTCVGTPKTDAKIRVIAITDDPLPSWGDVTELPVGEIGEICIQGPQVSSEYKDRPDANAAAKISDPDGGFWHRMGDCAYFDDRGRLWFCGRKSHRVICSDGVTVFPVRLEGVYNEHPAVFRSAVVGVDGAPVLVVELSGSHDQAAIATELFELGQGKGACDRVQTILFHPGFPVDRRHNAKIHRLELASWAQGRDGHGRA